MKTIEQIQNHPSWAAIPSATVRETLRVTFEDPEHDILKALVAVSPRAAASSRAVQDEAIGRILSHPSVQNALAYAFFGFDLSVSRDVPPPPGVSIFSGVL